MNLVETRTELIPHFESKYLLPENKKIQHSDINSFDNQVHVSQKNSHFIGVVTQDVAFLVVAHEHLLPPKLY